MEWLKKNTFHYAQFVDKQKLVELKRKKNLKISLCFPTWNEENTVGKEIIMIKRIIWLWHFVKVKVALRPGRKIYQTGAKSFPPHDAPITLNLIQTSSRARSVAEFVACLAAQI